MSATLVARGLAAAHGARRSSPASTSSSPRATSSASSASTAPASRPCCAPWPGWRPRTPAPSRSAPPTATVGHLPQEPSAGRARPSRVPRPPHRRRRGAGRAGRRDDALTEGAPGADDAYGEALERWLALGGADLDERAAEVAADLGLASPSTHADDGAVRRPGGAGRASPRCCSPAYDVLLLDEPTNDLDLAGLERLERFVRELARRPSWSATTASSSPAPSPGCSSSTSPSSRWRVVRRRLRGLPRRAGGRPPARARGLRGVRRHAGRRSQARARRSATGWPRACATPPQGGSDKDKNIRSTAPRPPRSRRRRSADRAADRAAGGRRGAPQGVGAADVRSPRPPLGPVVATLRGAVVRRGGFTPRARSTSRSTAADRVAITGANGAGKSTLLAALLGRLAARRRARPSLGSGVVVGEVDQARGLFLGAELAARRVLRRARAGPLADGGGAHAAGEVRARRRARAPAAATLSPGERTRAALALLQARGVNLLVLDEPTNHLDLPAIEQLESALACYAGTLLLVTHDRRMLRAVRRPGAGTSRPARWTRLTGDRGLTLARGTLVPLERANPPLAGGRSRDSPPRGEDSALEPHEGSPRAGGGHSARVTVSAPAPASASLSRSTRTVSPSRTSPPSSSRASWSPIADCTSRRSGRAP